jgi:hypothetical protein
LRKPQKEVSRNLIARSIRITRQQISVTNPAGVAKLVVALALSDQVPQVRHRHVRAVLSDQSFFAILAFAVAP